jgi:hypothetical protein
MDEIERELRKLSYRIGRLNNKIEWLWVLVIILSVAAFPVLGTITLWIAGFLLFVAIIYLIYVWLRRYRKTTLIGWFAIFVILIGASIPAFNWHNQNHHHIWGECIFDKKGNAYVWDGQDYVPKQHLKWFPCKK